MSDEERKVLNKRKRDEVLKKRQAHAAARIGTGIESGGSTTGTNPTQAPKPEEDAKTASSNDQQKSAEKEPVGQK